MMPAVFTAFAELAPTLRTALLELETVAACLPRAVPLQQWPCWEVLDRKLVPQLGDQAFLVLAVVGGTNIGKSVVFNHLAGFRASASSPYSSMTKHPVCLVPNGFAAHHNLPSLFPGFELQDWSTADAALQSDAQHLLFWKESTDLPGNLLILDTPDVDSSAVVNWERAEAIRQCADVLIAVLTQQKYNDAAVKQFFRAAAAADQIVVVVFNLVDIPDDDPHWPVWLRTFCEETGVQPTAVYLAPRDRARADALTLPFHERTAAAVDPVGRSGPGSGTETDTNANDVITNRDSAEAPPARWQDVFARLQFSSMKLRTLRGALRLMTAEPGGFGGYLSAIRQQAREYRRAAELLAAQPLGQVERWPTVPASELISTVQHWWAGQRQGWTAALHRSYDQVGHVLFTPVRWARQWSQTSPTESPWDAYRHREWDVIVQMLTDVYGRLERISTLDHRLLQQRLTLLLDGDHRRTLLSQLRRDHDAVDFSAELFGVVTVQLAQFQQENPAWFQTFRRLDQAAAAARPVLTVVLGIAGVGLPFGEAATHLASQGVTQMAMHVVGDVAGGALVATAGESAITRTASSSAGYWQAKFHQLQAAFARRRSAWLADRLQQFLLLELSTELNQAAQVDATPAFRQVQELLEQWARLLPQLDQPSQ
jgi:hypothetical protein